MLLYISPIIAIFVYFIAVHPLKINKWWKLASFALLFCISSKYFIIRFFGGPVFFAPDLPRFVMLFSAWIYAILLAWFILLLLSTFLYAILKTGFQIKKKTFPENGKKYWFRTNFILLGLSILCTSLSLYWGTCLPDIKEKTIYLKDLPREAEGMRIALLADLHIDYITKPEFIQEIVSRTNQTNPDLILISGDLVDGTIERCGKKVAILRQLNSPMGVWGVPGNHEYYSGYEKWMRFFQEEAGLKMLPNASVKLPNGVYLSGTTDQASKIRNMEQPSPEKAKHPEMKPEDCGILLAHNPKTAPKAKEFYDLQLSGHTHGGMILGLDLMVKQMNAGFVSGWYQVDNMQLYVSNGSAIWSGFPLRFGRPSEITLITLRKQK